jgi:hypothetical protein
MADDPIINILQNLPPTGIELGVKLVIYASLLAVILAIVFTWLSVRGRESTTHTSNGRKSSLSLTAEGDKLVYAKLEFNAYKQMNEDLLKFKNQGKITNSGYLKMNKYFMSEIEILEDKLNLLEDEDDEVSTPSVETSSQVAKPSAPTPPKRPEAISVTTMDDDDDEDLADITRDLESRLSGKDDDFLKQRKQTLPGFESEELRAFSETEKKKPGAKETVPEEKVEKKPSPKAPSPVSPSIPKVVSEPDKDKPKPMPTSQPTVKESKPNIPKPDMPSPMAPATPKAAEKPVIPKPEASKAVTPKSANPFQSATSSTEENMEDSKFAKSTSIAALRSDMLRELARLKKYIDEGEDQ